MNYFKKFYEWVMQKAKTPLGPYILFIISMIESVFSLFPLTVLFIALAIANIPKSFRFAAISTAGAVVGAIIGYGIGHFAWISESGNYTSLAYFFFDKIPGFSIDMYNNISDLYNKWGVLIIFVAGFTPMPFELITITSGVFNINFFLFVVSSAVGRGSRYFLLAFIIWKFGPGFIKFIEKYFNLLAFGLTACVIIGFIFVKFVV